MVLHRSNIEIPARFVFRPFDAQWQIGRGQLIGWGRKRSYPPEVLVNPAAYADKKDPVFVSIGIPDHSHTSGAASPDHLQGAGSYLSHTVEMSPESLPSAVLAAHENKRTSPDISGRPSFLVLVCSKRELQGRSSLYDIKPGDTVKNAWAMRDEFLNLDLGPTDEADGFTWARNLCTFLNRWGFWQYWLGFHEGSFSILPGIALLLPHWLREKREEYRRALEPRNRRKWLNTTLPLTFSTISEWPYFLVERFCCEDAIKATITIDHLAQRRFGFCRRCGRQFEQETQHKKSYCSRRCIQAAGVQRWRDKQRGTKKRKGAKLNAKG